MANDVTPLSYPDLFDPKVRGHFLIAAGPFQNFFSDLSLPPHPGPQDILQLPLL